MAITLTLDTYLAEKILRSDIVQNLGYEGIERVIEWYEDLGNDVEFDQSLFWVWSRYDNAIAAVMDFDSDAVAEIVDELKEDGEEVDEDAVDEKCIEWLEERTSIIPLPNGEVIVNTEF